MSSLHKCIKCFSYTFSNSCPSCSAEAIVVSYKFPKIRDEPTRSERAFKRSK